VLSLQSELAILIGVLALTAWIRLVAGLLPAALLLLAGFLAAALLLTRFLARVLGLLIRVRILAAHSEISLFEAV
jgi:hypothetical protein